MILFIRVLVIVTLRFSLSLSRGWRREGRLGLWDLEAGFGLEVPAEGG